MAFYVYMMVNRKNGVIYTGQTDDLAQRYWENRDEVFEGFTKDHDCKRLVWFEWHDTRDAALRRERAVKKWKRAWKIRELEKLNPDWDDLGEGLYEEVLYDPGRRYGVGSETPD